jgi:hypothetical protein
MVGLRRLSDTQKGESIVPLVRLFFFSDNLVDFQDVLKLNPRIRPSTEPTKKRRAETTRCKILVVSDIVGH